MGGVDGTEWVGNSCSVLHDGPGKGAPAVARSMSQELPTVHETGCGGARARAPPGQSVSIGPVSARSRGTTGTGAVSVARWRGAAGAMRTPATARRSATTSAGTYSPTVL